MHQYHPAYGKHGKGKYPVMYWMKPGTHAIWYKYGRVHGRKAIIEGKTTGGMVLIVELQHKETWRADPRHLFPWNPHQPEHATRGLDEDVD